MPKSVCSCRRYQEAEQAFRSALGRHPDYTQAHLSLAEALQAQDQIEEALASVERAIALASERSDAIALRSELLQQAGDRLPASAP